MSPLVETEAVMRSPLPQVRDSKATENCKKYETEPPERAKKSNTLILGLWLLELGENNFYYSKVRDHGSLSPRM